MGRHEPIRLRETDAPFAPDVEVVDVKFTHVSAARRSLWTRIMAGLQAVLWAAAIGFLIPPAWALIQVIGQTLWPR